MTRTDLERAAAFNLGMDSAAIAQASDSHLLAALLNWIGGGECSESEVLDFLRDSIWHPYCAKVLAAG